MNARIADLKAKKMSELTTAEQQEIAYYDQKILHKKKVRFMLLLFIVFPALFLLGLVLFIWFS